MQDIPVVLAAGLENTRVLLSLFVIFAAAKVMAEVFERLRQPAVVGEILAGVIVGPSLLGWAAPGEMISVLAEIAVIFLLFNVGLRASARVRSVLPISSKPHPQVFFSLRLSLLLGRN